MNDIVIIYHANCLDGLAGAYAVWKKFGNEASYVPAQYGDVLPDGLTGKEVYIIDFSYPKEALLRLEKEAKKLVVLDHHIGAKEAVTALREHIFDNNHSGAVLAWKYFQTDVPVPKLINYVEDNDLWRHKLPYCREIISYLLINIGLDTQDFEVFDKLREQFENEQELAKIVEKGLAYREYADALLKKIIKRAEEVEFEGYKVLAVNSSVMHSELGTILAQKHPPFAIVWSYSNGLWRFSLRGDGTIDLPTLVKKFGGGGHRDAVGFSISPGSQLPFKFLL